MTRASSHTFGVLTDTKTAKRFHRQFQAEWSIFSQHIYGFTQSADQLTYATLLLKRLLVLYFLQKQSLLDNDPCYLPHRLHLIQEQLGADRFYREYLLTLFAHLHRTTVGSEMPTAPLGKVPVLALSLFGAHALEHSNEHVSIPDHAFAQLFAFFDRYAWQMCADVPRGENELRPDILAYIFEHSIDQKQSGAYYTQEDITDYIASNTIIASLLTDLNRSSRREESACIWQLLQAHPDRYIHHTIRSTAFLPKENELEYQQRQRHYRALYVQLHEEKIAKNVDGLITCNLDLAQLAEDMIRSSQNPSFLVTVYTSLREMLILDPTCGTGAFLFAALATLAPLYTACLERMQDLLPRDRAASKDAHVLPLALQALQTILAQVEQHPTSQHFILWSIITQNLYGVDLMQDAVDICQLRLALALLASGRDRQTPDWMTSLRFNIRFGNSLVGNIHSPSHISRSPFQQSDQLSDTIQHPASPADTAEKPFHWPQEFPILASRGGFDVILGNPPYLEYNKVRQSYSAHGYEEKSCGNLYAAVIERSLALCRPEQSYLGLIVPISICGGERFAFLRRSLSQTASALWLANFEIFPCRLFENAFQRVSIVLMARHQPASTPTLQVTKIHRWFAPERAHLIQKLTYTQVEKPIASQTFPKLASPYQEHMIQKMLHAADGMQIATLLNAHKTRHFVYYQEATNYWTKAVCRVPYYRKNGEAMPPPHGRFLFFADERTARIIMGLMNSSLFYVWFTTYADGFHLSHNLVKTFPLTTTLLTSQELYELALTLEHDIQIHARLSTHNTRNDAVHRRMGHAIELEEYQMRYSKSILDEADSVIARYYGFTPAELDFIINYDIKYRLSQRGKSHP